jgi:hypothetical protein
MDRDGAALTGDGETAPDRAADDWAAPAALELVVAQPVTSTVEAARAAAAGRMERVN